MHVELAEFLAGTEAGAQAQSILRKCVHCGFCNATCPTYQLLGDELDGPRGRIYLMKQVFEGAPVTEKTRLHLDRCLTCRACETTCPSGVDYGRLVDIGRAVVESKLERAPTQAGFRAVLAALLPRPALFAFFLRLGRMARPLLPRSVRAAIPAEARPAGDWPAPRHARRMVTFAGCVQSSIAPRINAAAARVLDRLGISLVEAPAACCGALRFHLDRQDAGRADMCAMVDALWSHVEAGVEAIITTASGCGATVLEYGHHLSADPVHASRAARVAGLARDIGEVVAEELRHRDAPFAELAHARSRRVAFQSPCTLQHGQRVRGEVEQVLERAGFEVATVEDGHLCCGSAGTYSLLQPGMSRELRRRKLEALGRAGAGTIATANIGCLTHLAAASAVPVRHWIELVDEAFAERPPQ